MTTTFAFETQIERLASTARRCTEKYIEDGTEPVSRFEAKSPLAELATPGLGKGGA